MQKYIIFWTPLGVYFCLDFRRFWVAKSSQVDAKMEPKIHDNSERRVFKKCYFSYGKIRFFWDQRRPSWERKPTKNRLKNGVQDGMHLGIDFWAILVDFGCQVGVQNPPKIDQKWHRKNDWKKEGNKMANKTLKRPTALRRPDRTRPRERG